eukprot:scaffold36539_cov188-Isochrysis_galbana.AAC.1
MAGSSACGTSGCNNGEGVGNRGRTARCSKWSKKQAPKGAGKMRTPARVGVNARSANLVCVQHPHPRHPLRRHCVQDEVLCQDGHAHSAEVHPLLLLDQLRLSHWGRAAAPAHRQHERAGSLAGRVGFVQCPRKQRPLLRVFVQYPRACPIAQPVMQRVHVPASILEVPGAQIYNQDIGRLCDGPRELAKVKKGMLTVTSTECIEPAAANPARSRQQSETACCRAVESPTKKTVAGLRCAGSSPGSNGSRDRSSKKVSASKGSMAASPSPSHHETVRAAADAVRCGLPSHT